MIIYDRLARFAEARPASGSKDRKIDPDLMRLAGDLRDGRPLCGIAHEARTLAASGLHNQMDAARLRCLAKRIDREIHSRTAHGPGQ